MATTSVVSKLDCDKLAALFVSELAIRSMLDVGDELLQSNDVLSEVLSEVYLMIVELCSLPLNVGCLLAEEMFVHGFVDGDGVAGHDVGFADVVDALSEHYH